MQPRRILILAAVIIVVLSAAGCTTPQSSSPVTATPAAAGTAGATLSSLALTTADLSAGWTQVSARTKDASEVSRTARSLGWQAGYVATFVNSSAAADEQDTIVQTLTTYPETNIAGIMNLMGSVETNISGVTIVDLPVYGLGSSGAGFVARTTPVVTGPTTPVPVLSEIPVAEARKPAGPKQDFAEVYFTKGTTFEVIRMTGPHADGDAVLKLAQNAYAKIP